MELFDEAKEIAQSTLSDEKFPFSLQYDISIHVPLRGGRHSVKSSKPKRKQISIHVPLRGGRPLKSSIKSCKTSNFNPRPPTRGTTCHMLPSERGMSISIHVPLRGGRLRQGLLFQTLCYFNPRPPTRGTTLTLCQWCHLLSISIHVPLTRGTTLCSP